MGYRVLFCALWGVLAWAASDPVAARLAHEAREAQNAGQAVRAYLLYAEAAARDPQNPTYRANRDALAPAAKLLTKAEVETTDDISADLEAAEKLAPGTPPPVEFATEREWQLNPDLQPLPHLQPKSSLASFDTRGDEKSLFQQVASVYGIRPVFDPQLDLHTNVRFVLSNVDYRTAMEGLTAVTHTFVFPISEHEIFVARDTDAKRAELEPNVLLTFPLPNAVDQKDLIEAANAARQVLTLRSIGWDSATRTVMIRDRYTRATVARALLESLLLPPAQVSIELEFLTFDSDVSYHYGASLQTSYQIINFGRLGGIKNIPPIPISSANLLAFSPWGAALFGVGLTGAQMFAQYSNSFASNLFDATVVVADGQTANFHVGDKYPIPQSIYTGFQQTSASIYNPIGQVIYEDLGLVLKMTPHVNGYGDISLAIEANYKALGTQTFNTIPTISERQYKGTVSMSEGQWAVLAGMDSTTQTVTRTGLIGLSQIPGLNQLLSDNTRDKNTSNTLIVIKPTITRLPVSASVSPQFLIGPLRGERVLQ